MEATLIFNPNSGGNSQVSPDDLLTALEQAGYDPVYRPTNSEADLPPILEDASGLVVVAGGDGSVRAVASHLIQDMHEGWFRRQKKLPLAILPLGTANNICSTLGLSGAPLELIANLKQPRRRFFDVGMVYTPWGKNFFLESFGIGLFADTLAVYQPEKGKSILRSIVSTLQAVTNREARHYEIRVDGQDYSGSYLMVEALNTTTFGPWIKAAPQADTADALLDFVMVSEENRDSLITYIRALINETLDSLPSVDVHRGRKMELTWNGFPYHLDAEVGPPAERTENRDGETQMRIELRSHALEIWLPASQPETEAAEL